MQIIRITNPAVFQHQLVKDFFTSAAKANKFSQAESTVKDLSEMITQTELGCWVALDETGPQAVVVMLLPQSAFMECPQILMIYGQTREATKAVVEAALKFGTDAGYTKAWGVNRSGGSDEAFERLFGHVGFVRPVGTVLEYET